MIRLWLVNFEPGTSDDEIQAFLVKYGFPAFDAIEQIPGDGTRPGATITFNTLDEEALRRLLPRVHNIYWKNRKLNAVIFSERFT